MKLRGPLAQMSPCGRLIAFILVGCHYRLEEVLEVYWLLQLALKVRDLTG